MAKADGDYSCEAAVYQRLAAAVAPPPPPPAFHPKYHGCWTFNVAVVSCPQVSKVTTTRAVRLLLMEYVDGVDFDILDGWLQRRRHQLGHTEEAYGMRVWRRVLEAQAHLATLGISHTDEALRNIVVTPRPTLDPLRDGGDALGGEEPAEGRRD